MTPPSTTLRLPVSGLPLTGTPRRTLGASLTAADWLRVGSLEPTAHRNLARTRVMRTSGTRSLEMLSSDRRSPDTEASGPSVLVHRAGACGDRSIDTATAECAFRARQTRPARVRLRTRTTVPTVPPARQRPARASVRNDTIRLPPVPGTVTYAPGTFREPRHMPRRRLRVQDFSRLTPGPIRESTL